MPLLDVRSGSDFTGGGEGWILLALEFDSLAACDGCGRGCLRNSLGPASIPTKSTTTAITGSTYRRLDFDVCASRAMNSSAFVAPRVAPEACSWAAITCRVAPLLG